MFDVEIVVEVSIPIIGDKSIVKLVPPDGFNYKIIKFNEYEYKNKLIDGNGDIIFDYNDAIYEEDGINYIVILESYKSLTVQHIRPTNSIGFFNDFEQLIVPIKANVEAALFKYFSLLHLYKEGEVARKHSFYRFSSEKGGMSSHLKTEIISADMITNLRDPMKIGDSEIVYANKCLSMSNDIYELLKNSAIVDLEYCYHILDNATNYKNLVTILEILFIKKNETKIKDKLSKRVAVFLGSDDININNIYHDMRRIYINRSSAVHEGDVSNINELSLNELRMYTRNAIQEYVRFTEKYILKNKIENFNGVKLSLVNRLKKKVVSKERAHIFTK